MQTSLSYNSSVASCQHQHSHVGKLSSFSPSACSLQPSHRRSVRPLKQCRARRSRPSVSRSSILHTSELGTIYSEFTLLSCITVFPNCVMSRCAELVKIGCIYCRLQVNAGRLTSAEPWWEKNNPSNMKSITSVQEMVDAMVRHSQCCKAWQNFFQLVS